MPQGVRTSISGGSDDGWTTIYTPPSNQSSFNQPDDDDEGWETIYSPSPIFGQYNTGGIDYNNSFQRLHPQEYEDLYSGGFEGAPPLSQWGEREPTWPEAIRAGATRVIPAVAGSIGGGMVGGLWGGAAGGGTGALVGSEYAQRYELEHGLRRNYNPWLTAVETLGGAINPGGAGPIAGASAKEIAKWAAKRKAIDAVTGGGLNVASTIGTSLAEKGEMPSVGQGLSSFGIGTALGYGTSKYFTGRHVNKLLGKLGAEEITSKLGQAAPTPTITPDIPPAAASGLPPGVREIIPGLVEITHPNDASVALLIKQGYKPAGTSINGKPQMVLGTPVGGAQPVPGTTVNTGAPGEVVVLNDPSKQDRIKMESRGFVIDKIDEVLDADGAVQSYNVTFRKGQPSAVAPAPPAAPPPPDIPLQPPPTEYPLQTPNPQGPQIDLPLRSPGQGDYPLQTSRPYGPDPDQPLNIQPRGNEFGDFPTYDQPIGPQNYELPLTTQIGPDYPRQSPGVPPSELPLNQAPGVPPSDLPLNTPQANAIRQIEEQIQATFAQLRSDPNNPALIQQVRALYAAKRRLLMMDQPMRPPAPPPQEMGGMNLDAMSPVPFPPTRSPREGWGGGSMSLAEPPVLDLDAMRAAQIPEPGPRIQQHEGLNLDLMPVNEAPRGMAPDGQPWSSPNRINMTAARRTGLEDLPIEQLDRALESGDPNIRGAALAEVQRRSKGPVEYSESVFQDRNAEPSSPLTRESSFWRDERGSIGEPPKYKNVTAQNWYDYMKQLDSEGAPDTAYRDIMSTAGKAGLKRGETWRGKVLKAIDYFESFAKDDKGEFDPVAIITNLRKKLGREPTDAEIVMATDRAKRFEGSDLPLQPGTRTGDLTTFPSTKFDYYRLPDGRVIPTDATATKGAPTTGFTTKDGKQVTATLMNAAEQTDASGRPKLGSPLLRDTNIGDYVNEIKDRIATNKGNIDADEEGFGKLVNAARERMAKEKDPAVIKDNLERMNAQRLNSERRGTRDEKVVMTVVWKAAKDRYDEVFGKLKTDDLPLNEPPPSVQNQTGPNEWDFTKKDKPYGLLPDDALQSPYGEDVFPGEFPDDVDTGFRSFPSKGKPGSENIKYLSDEPHGPGDFTVPDDRITNQNITPEERAKLMDTIRNTPEYPRAARPGDTPSKAPNDPITSLSLIKKLIADDTGSVDIENHLKALGRVAGEVVEIPRGLLTALDLSATLRQGLPLVGTKAWNKAWGPMVSALGSDRAYKSVMQEILDRPMFVADPVTGVSWAKKHGMDILDLDAHSLTSREEGFASKFVNSIPGFRASNRAYSAFLNSLRAGTFEKLVADASGASMGNIMDDPLRNPKLAREIADYVNTATGRGPLKLSFLGEKEHSLEKMAPILARALFSPRLMASRVRMLSPGTYANAAPFVRRQYLESMARTAGAWMTFAGLGAMAGGDVNYWDPTSADFMKVRFGNTRIDPGGGFQQYLTAFARNMTGWFTSSEGRPFELGAGYRAESREEVTERFGENKFAPVPKLFWDLAKATQYRSVFLGDRLTQLIPPMIMQDGYEIAQKNPDLFFFLMPFVGLGMGTQTYEAGEVESRFIPPEQDYEYKGGSVFSQHPFHPGGAMYWGPN